MQGLPLATRLRPQILEDVLGQEVTKTSILKKFVESSTYNSLPAGLILWGPPGSGKTTIAYIIGKHSNRAFVELSATSSSVKDLREEVEKAKKRLELEQKETVLFIDEIHRFSKSQQDVLLPFVENKQIIFVAATTENPSFSIISPLLSRCILLTLDKVSEENIIEILKKAVKTKTGLNSSVKLPLKSAKLIAELSGGDVRKALTVLETCASLVESEEVNIVSSDIVKLSLDKAFVNFDTNGDQHYDTASAFIKSMRGSEPNAAIHYLAKMLVGGEDPRFIARRIMILASEDIGLADPNALTIASSCANIVEKIGMPEAELTLANAVLYMATAPKSNTVTKAIMDAKMDVMNKNIGTVPKHLRDSHYKGAKNLGHGIDYKYPHDYPYSLVSQQYLPDSLKDKVYFFPTDKGYEREIKDRMLKIDKYLGKNTK